MKSKRIFLIIGIVYFLVGLITLPHYGINWDTINHLPRGQAYLQYFLTGRKDYSNLPSFESYFQDPKTLFFKPDRQVFRRSLYQNDSVTYNWYLEHDQGHPPASDILSALFNKIFFQKLGLINDIDSYRMYGITLAAITVALSGWWIAKRHNIFAGLVTSLSISLYPLFWSESHFNNEKDIPETAYYTLFLYFVWNGVHKKSSKHLLMSGVFLGLALGTKFNILFIPVIVLPWLTFRIVSQIKNVKKADYKKLKGLVLSAFLALIIGLGIFVLLWPYLWSDIIGNLSHIFGYYKEIGTTDSFDPRFLGPRDINLFPSLWIAITTPIVTLVLSIIGLIYAAQKIVKDKEDYYLLLALWLIVPIARVSAPGANIYGGIRQIMEYVVPLGMFAGIGAYSLTQIKLKRFKFLNPYKYLLILLLFVPITIKLIQIHPNENVYFNKLIGGLSGAKSNDIPFWGNSFGAAYRQGVNWINENAPIDAHISYAHELIPNIPSIHLRSDMTLSNQFRSGFLKEGEFAITLTYEGTDVRSYYDKYLEKFLNPRYEVVVDGVPILKVWQNSPEYLRYNLVEKKVDLDNWENTLHSLRFTLPGTKSLSRLEYSFSDADCKDAKEVYMQISRDGNEWKRLPGVMPAEALVPALGVQPTKDSFVAPFTGELARYIDITISPTDACMYKVKSATLYYFENPPSDLLE